MNFKDLRIWQDSVELTVNVYKLIDNFPSTEKYGLSSQLARSVNSIGANIAESCGRYHFKDRINFIYHSRGSLIETEHHLIIAQKLGFISNDDLKKLSLKTKDLGIKINNYIKSINNKS